MSLALQVEGLDKHFGGVVAVAALDLTIRAGEVLALVGPNGAGKSTVINLITGMYAHDRGVIRIGGVDIGALPAHARAGKGLARSFQTPQIFPELTLAENVAIGAYRHAATGILSALWPSPRTRASRQRVLDRAAATLVRLGVTGDPTRKAGAVSYGDQKRVEFARALLLEPRVLLLDEPAAGLDPAETREIGAVVRQVAHAQSIAVLLVEHDMTLVRAVADSVVALDQGRSIATGTPAHVLSVPAVVEAYLGVPAAEARVADRQAA